MPTLTYCRQNVSLQQAACHASQQVGMLCRLQSPAICCPHVASAAGLHAQQSAFTCCPSLRWSHAGKLVGFAGSICVMLTPRASHMLPSSRTTVSWGSKARARSSPSSIPAGSRAYSCPPFSWGLSAFLHHQHASGQCCRDLAVTFQVLNYHPVGFCCRTAGMYEPPRSMRTAWAPESASVPDVSGHGF